jgi:hypothetical protein
MAAKSWRLVILLGDAQEPFEAEIFAKPAGVRIEEAQQTPAPHERQFRMWAVLSLARIIVRPGVYRDPVHFPILTSILREGLFKAARIRSDVRDNKSNKDGPAIQWFLIVKLTASIFEFADGGLAQDAAIAICKIEAPLVGFGIVQAQVQTLEVTCWAIRHELHQIAAAIPNFADHAGAIIFDPGRRPSQRMHQTPEVSFPSTHFEVEIVLPVPLRGSVLKVCAGYIWILPSESLSRHPEDKEAAHQGASSKTSGCWGFRQTVKFSAKLSARLSAKFSALGQIHHLPLSGR